MQDCLVTASCSFDRPVRTGDVLKLQVVLSPGRLFPGRAKTGACEQGLSVSVSTHHMSSYILVRLRLLCFFYEHDLAVRDPQVSCWSEAGISAGYKHDERMKENL